MFDWNDTIHKMAEEEKQSENEKVIEKEEVEDYVKSEIRMALINSFRLAEKNGFTDKEWVLNTAAAYIEEYKKEL